MGTSEEEQHIVKGVIGMGTKWAQIRKQHMPNRNDNDISRRWKLRITALPVVLPQAFPMHRSCMILAISGRSVFSSEGLVGSVVSSDRLILLWGVWGSGGKSGFQLRSTAMVYMCFIKELLLPFYLIEDPSGARCGIICMVTSSSC